MSVQLSVKANALLNQISIKPSIVLDIEGIDIIFGAAPVLKVLNWDDENARWDDGLFWDGSIEDTNARDWIELNSTTSSITQQIEPDKGSISSISTVNVSLIDKNGELSSLLALDNIEEILGRKCTFSLGFAEGSYPNDFQPVFRGVIVDFYTDAGTIMIGLASSNTLLRQSVLQNFVTENTEKIKYKELVVQDLSYFQRLTFPELLQIQYVLGSVLTANLDETLNIITVTITVSTTAKEIKDLFSNDVLLFNAVSVSVSGEQNNIQNTFPLTSFIIDTVINVNDTIGFIESQDALTSYVRVDDELMLLNSVDSATQITVTRNQLNSTVNSHDDESEVQAFYRLQGNPLELCLKLMLSNDDNEFFDSLDIPKSINVISPTESIQNAIIFDYYDIEEKTGLTVGDSIKLDSTSNTGTYTIAGFETLENGDSYILVNETLVDESEYANAFCYKSKYNTLPSGAGLGMLTSEVDVKQFESIINQFGSNFVDVDAYVKDTIDDATEFIRETLFAQGLYLVFRKARTSVKFVVPPFTSEITKTIDIDSITNINAIKQRRSTHKYLYNTYVYRYNQDSIDDKFLSGKITVSELSSSRIKVGRKQLKIDAPSLRNNPSTTNMITNISNRLIDRYRYAPTYLDDISVLYKDGYPLEIGDVIPFGSSNTKFTDLQTGLKNLPLALYEVKNKSINIKTGEIKLSLLSTNFALNARYGVISLASYVDSGSTTTEIKLRVLNNVNEYVYEADKWQPFIGDRVRIRSIDYTFDETRTILKRSETNVNAIVLDSPLSQVPQNGYVVEVPEYDPTSSTIDEDYKLRFTFNNSQVVITSSIDNISFEVAEPEKLVVGSEIYIHAKDYARDSFNDGSFKIESIVGNLVTLNKALEFTPLVNDLVEKSDYLDGGNYYALI